MKRQVSKHEASRKRNYVAGLFVISHPAHDEAVSPGYQADVLLRVLKRNGMDSHREE